MNSNRPVSVDHSNRSGCASQNDAEEVLRTDIPSQSVGCTSSIGTALAVLPWLGQRDRQRLACSHCSYTHRPRTRLELGGGTGDVILALLFVLNPTMAFEPLIPDLRTAALSPGLLCYWLMNDPKSGDANPAGVVTAPAATCIIDAARDFVVTVVPLAFPRLLSASHVKTPFQ